MNEEICCITNKVIMTKQATKFCSVRITGFPYSYVTVRVTTNNSTVPLFHGKGNDHLYND